MGVCCVEGCDSDDNDDITYFPFPIKPGLLRQWRAAVRSSQKLHQDSKVCSRHFPPTDYELVRGKLRLKGRVVPTIFHYDQEDSATSPLATVNGSSAEQDGGPKGKQNGRRRMRVAAIQTLEDSAHITDPDDSGECTIECVPEAVLAQDSDSHSETELHKEDIEDIIANYHIKQDRQLAERLRASGTEEEAQEKDSNRPLERDGTPAPAQVVVEVESAPEDKAPEYIEISVDAADKRASGDDCLMVLEKVQVDIDPAAIMLQQDDDIRDREPISLLTSSDSDDVIIEEPHVDLVEVSSETDEDDQPLVRLVKARSRQDKLKRMLWKNQSDYYCYQCKFTCLSRAEMNRHRLTHSTVMMVCDVCNFTCASQAQFSRHRKKHKEEKRFKCSHCDYRARHGMSLVYHMRVHADDDSINDYRCGDCAYRTSSHKDMLLHVRTCPHSRDPTNHQCDHCDYSTKRRNDLKRHRMRKHADRDDDYED